MIPLHILQVGEKKGNQKKKFWTDLCPVAEYGKKPTIWVTFTREGQLGNFNGMQFYIYALWSCSAS